MLEGSSGSDLQSSDCLCVCAAASPNKPHCVWKDRCKAVRSASESAFPAKCVHIRGVWLRFNSAHTKRGHIDGPLVVWLTCTGPEEPISLKMAFFHTCPAILGPYSHEDENGIGHLEGLNIQIPHDTRVLHWQLHVTVLPTPRRWITGYVKLSSAPSSPSVRWTTRVSGSSQIERKQPDLAESNVFISCSISRRFWLVPLCFFLLGVRALKNWH